MYSGATGVRLAGYGQGSGPITLDNVACTGSEAQLIDCPANAIGTHNCDHNEDAGVICGPVLIQGPGMHWCSLVPRLFSPPYCEANIGAVCYSQQ